MKAKDIRTMTVEEIESKLPELRDKLFKQKFQKVLGQSDNPHKIGHTRKDIARLLTILTEKRFYDGQQAGKEKKD